MQLEGYVEPTSPQAARPRRRRLSDTDIDRAADGNKAHRARRGKKREKADAALVARLRAWRLGIAKSRRMPAYRVLTDQTLLAVATLKPRTMEALMGVKGIEEKIAERYGQALLAVIAGSA